MTKSVSLPQRRPTSATNTIMKKSTIVTSHCLNGGLPLRQLLINWRNEDETVSLPQRRPTSATF